MTVSDWLKAAVADAERRDLPELRPLLEALAKATEALRATDWTADARDTPEVHTTPDGR